MDLDGLDAVQFAALDAVQLAALDARLAELGSVAVAFSGGVDSSVLAHAAYRVLGSAAVAVVADSASLPRRELEEARHVAKAIGIRLVELATDEQDDPDYQANRGDRCYFCKAALFRALDAWRSSEGIPWAALGEIADDALDDRPGRRAAQEAGVVAPLAEAGFTQAQVRAYARAFALPVADKPAMACLASRIPVGTRVSRELLGTVERAEDGLRDLGLRVVRVRHQGAHASVELGAADLAEVERDERPARQAVLAAGFQTVSFDRYLSPAERAARATADPA